jgi:putative flavoprotein involved in K+ transport
MGRIPVVVVVAGSAGLAVSHELGRHGIEHVVLWSIQLPDGAYDGPDPDGFLLRDDIAIFLERYARGFGAPVREGVEVTAIARAGHGGFTLTTSEGHIEADRVVLATGAYQRTHRPPAVDALAARLEIVPVDACRSVHFLRKRKSSILLGVGEDAAVVAGRIAA